MSLTRVAEHETTPCPLTEESPADTVSVLVRRVVPAVMVVALLAVAVRIAAAPVTNPDTFFHLRFGEEFLHGWSLRHPGHVTSAASADWVPTQWLPELVMAKVDAWFGLPGIAWLNGLAYVALVLALVLSARRVATLAVTMPLAVVALLACSDAFSMRPQLFSLLATSLTTAVWLGVRADPRRAPWLLVPLTWFWAMCHGMWPLGAIVSAVAVAGLVADGTLRGRRVVPYAAVPVLSGVTGALLTPVGPALLPAVLDVSSRGSYFTEWATPSFTSPPALALGVLVLVPTVIMVRRGGTWFDLGLVVLGAAFTVYSMRTGPIAACLLTPVAAAQLQRLTARPPDPVRRLELALLLTAAAAALACLAAVVPVTSSDPPAQPAWVDQSLSRLPAGTEILNSETLGGYLMWRYPQLDFTYNGYGDIYTRAELDARLQLRSLAPGWQRLLAELDPAYALVAPQSPLASALVDDGWQVLHRSPDLELLSPPSATAPG